MDGYPSHFHLVIDTDIAIRQCLATSLYRKNEGKRVAWSLVSESFRFDYDYENEYDCKILPLKNQLFQNCLHLVFLNNIS